ncbi:MAG: TetR/AcrR family transcriptional regulator [Leptospiraceae bacterium]|nr:TetR/AcrR family transcriptional regulator [Leptospiraceae bacterium]
MKKKVKEQKNAITPKDRILNKSMELFYEQGFANTGINQIIEESSSFKKSFYTYFSDKNSLGLSYLELQEKDFLNYMRKMIQKHDTYEPFVRSWVSLQRKMIRLPKYNGCPFALFTNQSLKDAELFQSKIKGILENWKILMVQFIDDLKSKGNFPKTIDSTLCVKKIILYYEGAIQSYVMTRDPTYLSLLEEELIKLPKS